MMAAMVEAEIIWQPNDYVFFKKCGEITISPDVQNIGFNCLFCTGICLQNDAFLQHLQDQHKEEVFKLYESQSSIVLEDQVLLENNFGPEFVDINLNENLNNNIYVNASIALNPLQSKINQELNENCMNIKEQKVPPTSDLNSVYDIHSNNLLELTPSNQGFDSLITLNPYENLTNNITASNNSYTITLTNNTVPTFGMPSNSISASLAGIAKRLPDNNEFEIGDGEDSGVMLVQSPCQSDGGGLSDCMLFTEDSSSKSGHDSNETLKCATKEHLTNSCKRKYLKTPAMCKTLNNKDLIKYILEAYRKTEKLWNPKHPSYKYNAHRTIYNELSQPLLNDKNCHLTGEEIFGIITELRGRYRRELKKFQVRKGKHKTRLWYFEKMSFLRDIIEEKRKERGKYKDSVIDADSKGKKLTNRQILSFILELYCQNECLWNPKHEDYGTCNKAQIHDTIAEHLKKKFNVCMTSVACLNEVKKLRIRYRKELTILEKLKGHYTPKLWCFDEMEFLRPAMEENTTKNFRKTNDRALSSLTRKKNHFQNAVGLKFSNLEQHLKFIEIYRSHNCLWDVDHPDYRSTYYRRKALNEMMEVVNVTNVQEKKCTIEQLEKTIYLLRKDFSNEKLRHLTQRDTSKEPVMSFVLYKKIYEFLGLNMGPFSCDTCQRLCKTYDQYKIHKSKHDGTLPFICTLCGKGFQMPGNLTIHLRRHRRDFPYSCEICKKSFATSTEVSIHLRSHTGERPYACEWCDKKFKTWSFYNLHRRTHLNQSNFHCPICDKSFYERNRFTDHMNIHLNIRKHQCDQCGKGFTTVGNLKKHLDLHAAVKKHTCQPCGKSFAQFASLRWHRKTQHEPSD